MEGLIRIADAHELLPPGNATWDARADSLVKTNVQAFVNDLTATASKKSTKTWVWPYKLTSHGAEDIGHGQVYSST